MRLIDADEAKKQIKRMQTLKPPERMLLRLALDRTPTHEPPNDPLTPDQLREMDGEPVWITPGGFWALVIARRGERVRLINHEGEIVWADKEIELVGPIYRRRPE